MGSGLGMVFRIRIWDTFFGLFSGSALVKEERELWWALGQGTCSRWSCGPRTPEALDPQSIPAAAPWQAGESGRPIREATGYGTFGWQEEEEEGRHFRRRPLPRKLCLHQFLLLPRSLADAVLSAGQEERDEAPAAASQATCLLPVPSQSTCAALDRLITANSPIRVRAASPTTREGWQRVEKDAGTETPIKGQCLPFRQEAGGGTCFGLVLCLSVSLPLPPPLSLSCSPNPQAESGTSGDRTAQGWRPKLGVPFSLLSLEQGLASVIHPRGSLRSRQL